MPWIKKGQSMTQIYTGADSAKEAKNIHALARKRSKKNSYSCKISINKIVPVPFSLLLASTVLYLFI